jgi:hypothetical protein
MDFREYCKGFRMEKVWNRVKDSRDFREIGNLLYQKAKQEFQNIGRSLDKLKQSDNLL